MFLMIMDNLKMTIKIKQKVTEIGFKESETRFQRKWNQKIIWQTMLSWKVR